MLMHRFGKLSAALTLGVVVVFPLAAQRPTDLADVCKVLGGAKPGQWAPFDRTSGGSGRKSRLAVVGSERSGDPTPYWFEATVAGKHPRRRRVAQTLTD